MNYLTEMYVRFMNSIKSEKGQTIVEYALLLVLIAIVVIIIVKGVGLQANNAYSKVNSALAWLMSDRNEKKFSAVGRNFIDSSWILSIIVHERSIYLSGKIHKRKMQR